MSSPNNDLHTSCDMDILGTDVEMISANINKKHLKPWSDLPTLALEKIYCYLSRKDQCRMSQVCRKWCRVYSYPSVWRSIKLYLPGHGYSNVENYPEVKFARKYGHMVRHIEVICRRIELTHHFLDVIHKQFKLFLQFLSMNTQLISISFMDLNDIIRDMKEFGLDLHEDIFMNIVKLLTVQRNLKRIQFFNSQFEQFEAAEILQALCENNSGKLQTIVLKKFVRDSPFNEMENNQHIDFMHNTLLNLHEIEIDYSQMFEQIIHAFSDQLFALGWSKTSNMRGALTKMNINCEGSRHIRFKGISSSIWKQLGRIFPALQVGMYLNVELELQRAVEFFIPKNIPLRALDLRYGRRIFPLGVHGFRGERFHTTNRQNISFLFHHIIACGYNNTLEELTIVWMHPLHNLENHLVPFLLECSQLRVLQLNVNHPATNLENIFKSWLENRPKSLETVYLSPAHIGDRGEVSILSAIVDYYIPLFQVLGLKLVLIPKVE